MKFKKQCLKMIIVFGVMLGLLSTVQAAEFKIGALNPLTGVGGPYGPGMLQAIKLGAEEVNKAGGILGQEVIIISEDTQTDPDAAVRAAKKLIEVNKVSAILGTWSSGITMSVLPLTTRAGIIEMSVSGAPAISKIGKETGMVFRTQASNTMFGVVFSKIAVKEGYKKAATMAFNNPSGRGNTEEFAKNFKASGGAITGGVVYEGNKPSYRSEIEKVLATKPEVVVMGSYIKDTTIILKEWYQLNEPMKWIAPAWAVNPKLIKTLGPDVTEGVIAVDTVPNTESKTYDRFVMSFKKATGDEPKRNPYAAMVYDQMILLALAAEAAQSTDPNAIAAKLRDVSGPPGEMVYSFEEGVKILKAGKQINYDGASSAIDFNASGDVSPTFGVYRVEKGELPLKYTMRP
jgi:branched-chain amino acid transport system substrate-binding protein